MGSIFDKNGTELHVAYQRNGTAINTAYKRDGTVAWDSNQHLVSDTFRSTLLFDIPELGSGSQGIACDSLSQSIAQLYTLNIYTINLSDGSYVKRNSSTFNLVHGHTGQFAPEKNNLADLYPPLYVSPGGIQTVGNQTYQRLLEVFVRESTCILNRVFLVPVPADKGAGYGRSAIDFENGILYQVYGEKYEPAAGETYDYTYIRAFDMTETRENTDATDFSPVNGFYEFTGLLDEFTVPYIEQLQSTSFFDGLIACLSDVEGVVFIEPTTHSVYLTIRNGIVPFEREGIGFILNPETGETDMILSARQQTFNVYYRYQFIL